MYVIFFWHFLWNNIFRYFPVMTCIIWFWLLCLPDKEEFYFSPSFLCGIETHGPAAAAGTVPCSFSSVWGRGPQGRLQTQNICGRTVYSSQLLPVHHCAWDRRLAGEQGVHIIEVVPLLKSHDFSILWKWALCHMPYSILLLWRILLFCVKEASLFSHPNYSLKRSIKPDIWLCPFR